MIALRATLVHSTPAQPGSSVLGVYRTVTGFMLLALIWKFAGFMTIARVYRAVELDDPFFPKWLQHADTFLVAYTVALIASTLGLILRNPTKLLATACANSVALAILCVHQGSYNDVTFFTAMWASFWCLWFLHRSRYEPIDTLLEKGASLANMILALFLLGGAVGKWTSEYWSGSVLYEIYFIDRDYWVFNLIRSVFAEEYLPTVAKWYSRMVIATETIVAVAIWGLPRHHASAVAMTVFMAIAIMSNIELFSVVFSAIGLATVGLYLHQHRDKHAKNAFVKSYN